MLVQTILQGKTGDGVVTVPPDATLLDAARTLAERRIGALVVSEDGIHARGILSERDIVRELGRRGAGCMTDRVDTVMTTKVIGCAAGDRADEVLQKMTDGRFRHMPVMERDELRGMISIGDVVKARLAELAMEKDALEGMIKGF